MAVSLTASAATARVRFAAGTTSTGGTKLLSVSMGNTNTANSNEVNGQYLANIVDALAPLYDYSVNDMLVSHTDQVEESE